MSTCISRHGEFSEHTLDNSHTCTLCHVLDEDALRAELADPRRDPMYHDRYWAVQHVLNEALGPNEEDGTGEGIAADVALLASQRDEARAALAAVEQDRDRLSDELDDARITIRALVGHPEPSGTEADYAPLTDLIGIAPDREVHGTEDDRG